MTAPAAALPEEAALEQQERTPEARRSIRLPSWFGGAVGVLIIIAVWTIVALVGFRSNGAVPTPVAVLRQYGDDGWAFYSKNISVTVHSALFGYIWGNALAIALAILVLLVPPLERVATQVAVISYCMPLTAIGPIILVVFGGRYPSIVLAGTGVFFTTLVGALLGLKSADRTSLDLVTAYGGGRWQRMVKVQAIAALPATISALKIAAPTAMLGAIIGEYLGGVDSGLGVAITAAQQEYLVPRTWGLAIACGLVAGIGYVIVGVVGRLITPWARTAPTSVSAGAARGAGGGWRFMNVGRDIWAVVWPMALAVVIAALGWLIFLKAFSIKASIGKTPADVWKYLFTASGASTNRSTVWHQLTATLHDAALGYVGGMVAAIVIGLLFVLFAPVEQAFMPIAMLFRSVPLVAMTPIILLIFKRGSLGVAVIGGIVVFFPALVNIVFGLRSSSAQARDLVSAYGGNRWIVLRKVALPTALPAIFAAARISVPGSLIGALVAEWLATGTGIGGAINNAIGEFDYNQVWADIAILTGVSLLIYTIVGVIETFVLDSFGFTSSRG
jgi:ABC-type nitrate/sulfonate/bicarbonate transport system permease component